MSSCRRTRTSSTTAGESVQLSAHSTSTRDESVGTHMDCRGIVNIKWQERHFTRVRGGGGEGEVAGKGGREGGRKEGRKGGEEEGSEKARTSTRSVVAFIHMARSVPLEN